MGRYPVGADVVSGEFLFATAADHSRLANGGFGADNGSTYFASDDFVGDNPVIFTNIDDNLFSLISLDLSEWEDSYWKNTATSVTFNGLYAGGGSEPTRFTWT